MFFSIAAAGSGQPLCPFGITQETNDSPGDLSRLRRNQHRPITIENRAMGRDVGGDDRAASREVVEYFEREITTVGPGRNQYVGQPQIARNFVPRLTIDDVERTRQE
jgi:hypothetical protein